jgi:hypothetical protein
VGPQAGGGPAALYYVDGFASRGADLVLPALQAKGYAVTRAHSWTEFTQALNTTKFALAVALNQVGAFDDVDATAAALSAHLAAGRAAWLADWTLQASVAAPFQGGYAGPTNQQPVSISAGHLAAGVASPLPLSNAGNTWSWSLAAAGGAVALASFPDGSPAVVLGNGGRSALLGFGSDSVTSGDGQQFFENLVDITTAPSIQPLAVQPECDAAVGAPVTVTVTATAVNSNLVAESIDWGDGSAPDRASFDPTDAHSATFSHAYTTAGIYAIVASAADARGATVSRGAPCHMGVYNDMSGSGFAFPTA